MSKGVSGTSRQRAPRSGLPGGHFTNPDKIFWPKEGYTKGDVIRYYARVAPFMLPYLRDRPMVLARNPDGIARPGFFQKNVDPKHLPPFVKTVAIRARSTQRNVHYIVCDNTRTLLYLANLGCIEVHPWLSRTAHLRKPDWLVLDLDPGGNPYREVVQVARAARRLIEQAGGTSLVKTSGKSGIHVVVPLSAQHDFDEVRAVAKKMARLLNKRLPHLTTPHPNAGRRSGRIYIDFARNSFGQTIAAPYSLRAFPGATISTPLDWTELSMNLRPQRYALRSIFRRLDKKGDIWKRRRAVNLDRLSARLDRIIEAERREHGKKLPRVRRRK